MTRRWRDALHALQRQCRTAERERLDRHYLANSVGQPTETTLALSHLIFSGLLDRYPRCSA
jgi:hypothetical protein